MARGKRQTDLKIVVVEAAELKFKSRDEAWQVAGPILARILAQVIKYEKQKEAERASGKDQPSAADQKQPKSNSAEDKSEA